METTTHFYFSYGRWKFFSTFLFSGRNPVMCVAVLADSISLRRIHHHFHQVFIQFSLEDTIEKPSQAVTTVVHLLSSILIEWQKSFIANGHFVMPFVRWAWRFRIRDFVVVLSGSIFATNHLFCFTSFYCIWFARTTHPSFHLYKYIVDDFILLLSTHILSILYMYILQCSMFRQLVDSCWWYLIFYYQIHTFPMQSNTAMVAVSAHVCAMRKGECD